MAATTGVADITRDKVEPRPCLHLDGLLHFIEVFLFPRRKVVHPPHPLPKAEQIFDQMRPDEPRRPGDKPRAGTGEKFGLKGGVAGHFGDR